MIKIKFHANWCHDYDLKEMFNRCTLEGNYRWEDLLLTENDDYDFFIIMNYPRHKNFDPSKTIVFQSEPFSTRNNWGEYSKPDKSAFFKVYDTENYHNVDKWYVNLNYKQLLTGSFSKTKVISGVVSSLNFLPGHITRYNFLKYLNTLPFYDHYGRGNFDFLNNFKGELNNKEDGLIPYKYHFNAENTHEKNYFTEKIIDAVLCECLCFYDGCPNLEEFIDSRAYIRIDLNNPNEALHIIRESIANHEYEKRIEIIKKEKYKLMNEMNPLNIVNKIIKGEIK